MANFFQALGGMFALIMLFNFIDWVTSPTSGLLGVLIMWFMIIVFIWFIRQLWLASKER